MIIRRFYVGDFLFTELEEGFYSIFHPLWEWCERVENGKKYIRLKAR